MAGGSFGAWSQVSPQVRLLLLWGLGARALSPLLFPSKVMAPRPLGETDLHSSQRDTERELIIRSFIKKML